MSRPRRYPEELLERRVRGKRGDLLTTEEREEIRRLRRDNLVLDALTMALGLRGPGADVELVHHGDRGSST
jgi:hypothetical protein